MAGKYRSIASGVMATILANKGNKMRLFKDVCIIRALLKKGGHSVRLLAFQTSIKYAQ
jgi:hypothetical protein